MYQRDISKPLQFFRALLLGRTWNNQNRFQDQLSPRPYPKPDLNQGVAHKAFDNYYVNRDARRSVLPPQTLQSPKQIGDSKSNLPPTPGHVHRWD
ncbi:NADH dehydrogenase [ubiquinone] 1 alpha subcomplex subunit 7 [Dermatophagoides farinae]|uniref:NADH dehydrogenase [ubiquinone] 1 alpha subcomplex subunit 7 n=1 Tax=Dermatophagoides farinae TaxID=6954 RepID=A0A922HSF4_DERFA|nr:NADH dehydrogenase [ubiquinone] 1 alpha subcomplex subunit 7-like [Dermatophagoides farinae]KAH7637684.1 hypothetical protein HUG17_8788 [Dermatophagoides farinae]KAH9501818.1 NADH dehydrogenase [ubiquinone] 1 alpha subcomplex subunit 7 [Dermatophagoides farinae]